MTGSDDEVIKSDDEEDGTLRAREKMQRRCRNE